MPHASTIIEPIDVFYCYSHKDELLRDELEKHLSTMRRQGLISSWHDRRIGAGYDWEAEIDEKLNSARLVLLLVSSDFVSSDYCISIEMKRAMERHEQGKSRVVPVILRPVDWQGTPFAKLQALPKDGKPISIWANFDEAFLDVANGIRLAIESLPTKMSDPNNLLSTTQAKSLSIPAFGENQVASLKGLSSPLQYEIVLRADADTVTPESIAKMLDVLRGLAGDATLTLQKVERGSLILTLLGSVEGLRRLMELKQTGQLSNSLGYLVESISLSRPKIEKRAISMSPPEFIPSMPRNTGGRRKKLYVGNLGFDVSSSDLEKLLSEYGTVQSAEVISDRMTGRSKGFGFVEMSNDEEANAAISDLNGQEHGGRPLIVNEAKPREPRTGGGGGTGGRGGYGSERGGKY